MGIHQSKIRDDGQRGVVKVCLLGNKSTLGQEKSSGPRFAGEIPPSAVEVVSDKVEKIEENNAL